VISKWGSWHSIDDADSNPLSRFGIYQIRMVDRAGNPIPVRRIAGLDKGGVIYIGGSGYSKQHAKKPRTMAQRIKEFEKGAHSGGHTYRLMKDDVLLVSRKRTYSGHKLQYKAMRLDGGNAGMVKEKEIATLARYFKKYGELPPCNSSFPSWNKFKEEVESRSAQR
jgi:hypothetical protein